MLCCVIEGLGRCAVLCYAVIYNKEQVGRLCEGAMRRVSARACSFCIWEPLAAGVFLLCVVPFTQTVCVRVCAHVQQIFKSLLASTSATARPTYVVH